MADLMTMSTAEDHEDHENDDGNRDGTERKQNETVKATEDTAAGDVDGDVDDVDVQKEDESKGVDSEQNGDQFQVQNAEEVDDPEQTATVSMDATFGDLQQFADGLDLENVEVDSDTEQNFEMLLEELNDENSTQKVEAQWEGEGEGEWEC